MIKRIFLATLVLLIGLTAVIPSLVGADPAAPAIPDGHIRIHYLRPTSYTTGNLDDFQSWGLHGWSSNGDLPGVTWASPQPLTGADDIGVYFDANFGKSPTNIGVIIHNGDDKSGTGGGNVTLAAEPNEIWFVHGSTTKHTTREAAIAAAGITPAPAVAAGKLRIYLYKAGDNYEGWLLNAWGDITGMASTGKDAWGLPYWEVNPPSSGDYTYSISRASTSEETGDLTFVATKDSVAVNENWVKLGNPSKASRMNCLFGNSLKGAVLNSLREIVFTSVRSLSNEQLDGIKVFDGATEITGWTKNVSAAPRYVLTFSSDLDYNKTYKIEVNPENLSVFTVLNGSLIDSVGVTYDGNDLGATYSSTGTTFKLWAPLASAVQVYIYDAGDEVSPSINEVMAKDSATGVWSTTVTGDLKNKFYQYRVTNAGIAKLALDPYAKSMASFDIESADKVGKAAIVDLADTNPAGWDKDKYIYVKDQEDVIIYEVSVRDLTIHESSGVAADLRGKYRGFIKKIPYLKKLGVTHVQLLPVQNWYYGNEMNQAWENTPVPDPTTGHSDTYGSNYNWGYDPHNYFSPEGWYATDPENPTVRIKELKELIQALHKAGIGVVLDVVYNHTANTDIFESIVPNYYYRRNADGSLANGSGCGNDTASEREMFRKLMIESATYWVDEYHIDGFRFDLQGLHDRVTMQQLADAVRAINPSINLHGEGWDMGTLPPGDRYSKQNSAGWSALEMEHAIAHFSDGFRDGVIQPSAFDPWPRGGFVQRDGGDDEPRVRRGIVGNLTNDLYPSTKAIPIDSGAYNCFTDDPEEGVNYTNCHDGLTLRDKIWSSMANETEAEKIKALKLASAMVMTAQGKPFFQGGDEILRSHPWPHSKLPSKTNPLPYAHNTHDMGDDVNHFDFTGFNNDDEHTMSTFHYLRGLIEMRKQHEAFRMETAEEISAGLTFVPENIPHFIAYRLQEQDGTDPWKDIYVFYNANPTPQSIAITGINNSWNVVVDDRHAGVVRLNEDSNVVLGQDTITVPGRSCVVIHAPKGRVIQPQRRSFFWRFFRNYFNR